MSFIELFLLAVGLSMDAFAVALCKGLGMRRFSARDATIIALFFGGFQALMPVIGWLLGSKLLSFIEPIDHWVAFALLAYVGGKMLWDGFHDSPSEALSDRPRARLNFRELLMLAIATSIDALAVGVTFALVEINIAASVALIGVVTFALSFFGVAIGKKLGTQLERPATILGGIILLALGVKILLEHLGLLAF